MLPWAVSIGAVVALCWVGWAALAARVADQVSATWDLRCHGTTVGRFHGSPAIRSRPGWTCDVVLRVVNDSGRAIRLTAVEAPFMGTVGGAEVQGRDSLDARIRDADAVPGGRLSFGDVDAVWDLDDAVPARSTRRITLVIGWRESGCNSAGHFFVNRWPTVLFEALGRSHSYSPHQRLVLRTYDDPHDAEACRS